MFMSVTQVSHKPKSLRHVEATSIPYVAATAWSAIVNTGGLNKDNSSKKRQVLICKYFSDRPILSVVPVESSRCISGVYFIQLKVSYRMESS